MALELGRRGWRLFSCRGRLSLQALPFTARSPGAAPQESFKPDGVILFSDILTPLTAFGVEFEIDDNKGPILDHPLRSSEQARPAGRAGAGGPCATVPPIGQRCLLHAVRCALLAAVVSSRRRPLVQAAAEGPTS